MTHGRPTWRALLLAAPVLALAACGSQLDDAEMAPPSSQKPFDSRDLKPLEQGVSALSIQNLGSALGAPVTSSNTCGVANQRAPSCAYSAAPDVSYRWTAPYAGNFTLTTFGSGYDSILHIYDATSGAALGCNDDAGGTFQSSLALSLSAGQSIIIVVDGYAGNCGAFRLNISGAASATCTPTTTPTRSPTWDSRWTQGLSLSLDNAIIGADIGMYRIQWFNGTWSPWYTPGVDDIDWKTNNDGTQRRVWSYFVDHNHQFYIDSGVRSPTWDSRWKQGLSGSTDNTIIGKDIALYRIQWFNGTWSPWYTPCVDDVDWVRNDDGSQRRVWSYFIDHNHQFYTNH